MSFNKKWSWPLRVILFAVMLMTLPVRGWALSFDYLKTPLTDGFQYDFTLSNDLGEDIFEVFLELPAAVDDLSGFLSPVGWGDGMGDSLPFYGAVTTTDSFIEWFAEPGSELASGFSLSGYSFISASDISGSITFSVNSDPYISGESMLIVPEPGTLILLGSGVAGIGYLRRRAHSRKEKRLRATGSGFGI